MRSAFFALLVTSLFTPMPVKAESIEITDPSWQKVPGTLTQSPNEQYDGSAHIDSNSIVRSGDIVSYNVLGPDASYSHVETNCHTNQFRATWQGYFQTATSVVYFNQIDPWGDPTGSYQKALLSFVCDL